MPDYGDTFRREAEELLAEMEAGLLALAEAPGDPETVNELFRAVHTLKGSGAMFGSGAMVDLAHELETVLDCVREGALAPDRHLVNLGLGVCDALGRLAAGQPPNPAEARLSEALRSRLPESCSPDGPSPAAAPRTFRLRMRPAPNLLIDGTRPLLLLDELRAMGSCEVQVRKERVPALAELEPERCYLAWDIALTTGRDADAIRDVFIFAEDRCRVSLTETDRTGKVRRRLVFGSDGDEAEDGPAESNIGPEPGGDPGGEIPEGARLALDIESPDIESPDYGAPDDRPPNTGHLETGQLSIGQLDTGPLESAQSDAGEPAPGESKFVPEAEPDHPDGTSGRVHEKQPGISSHRATVRVPAERLDALVDLVGELVTVQAGLGRLARRSNEPELERLSEAVERLTADLRDTTIRVRMTPLGTAFTRLRRLVHDLSDQLGKPAILVTAGGETELDKSVMEGLLDPMVHLLRNCLDHGIEPPEIRAAAGKPPQARVSIDARHAGGNVVVRIADDGAGIDAEAVRKAAAARGLLPPGARPEPEALFRLIFEPGFSTRDTAGDLSGRGVGLDVVRNRVEALRGRIEVTSRPGEGTAFLLTLPLTLAIIDGLLVSVDGVRYVLPLSAVEECMEGAASGPEGPEGGNGLIRVRDAALSRVSLRDLFRANGTKPGAEQLVIVRAGERRAALAVDEVIGDHQTVIKSLGAVYRRTRVFSGATVLDDGRVALILDPQRLVETAEAEQFSEEGNSGSWLSPS
jgi:two-component system chemotaxis sensor kinase CheA